MIKVHDIAYNTPGTSVRDLNEWLGSQGDNIEIINIETLMNIYPGTKKNSYLKPEYLRIWYRAQKD